jgi:antitoxin HigA-1
LIIADIIADVGVSAREAARSLGVNHQAFANVLNGKSAISPEMAVRLQAFMGNGEQGAEFWLRLQADYDLWHARKRLAGEIAKVKPAPREPRVA